MKVILTSSLLVRSFSFLMVLLGLFHRNGLDDGYFKIQVSGAQRLGGLGSHRSKTDAQNKNTNTHYIYLHTHVERKCTYFTYANALKKKKKTVCKMKKK